MNCGGLCQVLNIACIHSCISCISCIDLHHHLNGLFRKNLYTDNDDLIQSLMLEYNEYSTIIMIVYDDGCRSLTVKI